MRRRDLLGGGLALGAAALVGCTTERSERAVTSTPTAGTAPPASPPGRVLLACFSRAGENYYNGGRIELDVGNTEVVANLVADALDVTMYRIEAAEPYPHSYDQTVARNVQEELTNARPAIARPLPDLAGYSTILLGCPVWNVQSPMIMRTFLDGLRLDGMTIHPFVTYAVSGIGRVRGDYAGLAPNATITEGLAVRGETARDARNDVRAWLRGLGLLPS